MTPIPDSEIVCRHVPGGTTFIGPGPRLTSKNFALRQDRGEVGISVSRLSITTGAQLLARVGDTSIGSRLAVATVEEIRALGLDVIADPIPEDLGHSLIVAERETLDSQAMRKKLAMIFQFIDLP